MSKAIVAAIIIAVIVIAGGGAYLATRGGDSGSNSTKNGTDTSMQGMDMSDMKNMGSSEKANDSTPVATDTVTIENFAYSPADITVKKGTTVTWTNKDSTAHTVTENDGKAGPDSGTMDNGKSYSFTYNTVGTFKYHCTFHPNMLGTVTVTE